MKIITGYIYLIIDLLTGKKYVGQHHYNKPELDPNYHGSGRIVKRLYKKRPETLKMEYIKTCYSEEELNESEKYFIFVYNTLYPNGYNLTEGGEGGVPSDETRKKISEARKGLCTGENHQNFGKHLKNETRKKISEANKGKHPSDETRKKLSESRKGKHLTDETKKKMSEKLKGENHPLFGKHHSDEAKKKISEANKGKHPSDETRKKLSERLMNGKYSKIVLQFTLDGEFVREWFSTMECGRNEFEQSNIVACCNGKRKSHKNFIWLYKDDIHLLKERVDNIKNKCKGENPLKKLPDYSCYGQPLF